MTSETLFIVDIDETLVLYLTAFLRWLAATHQHQYQLHHFTEYHLATAHANAHPGEVLEKNTIQEWLREFHLTPEFQTLQPLANVAEVLSKISQVFMVLAISGRQLDTVPDTQAMLGSYFDDHIDGLVHCNQFPYREPWESQSKTARANELLTLLEKTDYIVVEDSLSALLEYHQSGNLRRGYLIDNPWNQTTDSLPETIVRVPAATAWQEILADLSAQQLL